jgi:Domain of unknown function (DUF4169)
VSADVVNLRRARKAAKRAKAEAEAAANRTAFGTSGAERARIKDEKQRGERHLDQHRLTPTNT